jgi:hypothetical protein
VNRHKFNEQHFAGQLANPGNSLHFYLRKTDTKAFNKKCGKDQNPLAFVESAQGGDFVSILRKTLAE